MQPPPTRPAPLALPPFLQLLEARLKAALAANPDQELVLDEVNLGDGSAGVVALFQETLGAGELTLGGTVEFAESGAFLKVTGTAAGKPYDLESAAAACWFGVEGTDTLTLVAHLAPEAAWKFSDSFFNLEGTFWDDLQFTSPAFILSTGETTDPAFAVEVGAGANLYIAPTAIAGPLEPALQLVTGTVTPTPFVGPLVETAEARTLSLAMPFPDVNLAVGQVSPMKLTSTRLVLGGDFTPDPWFNQNFIAAESRVALGGVELPLAVTLPDDVLEWRVGLIPGEAVPVPGLSAFFSIFSGYSLGSAVPADVLPLPGFEIDGFYVGFDTVGGDFRSFYVGVRTRTGEGKPWTVIPGVLEVNEVAVRVLVQRLAQAGGTTATLASGSLGGTVTIGGGIVLRADLPLPVGTGLWTFSTAEPVGLPSLGDLARFVGGASLADLLPGGVGNVGGFTLQSTLLAVDPAQRSLVRFAFALSSTADWVIIPGRLALRDLLIRMDVDHPFSTRAVTGQVAGTLSIGQVDVDVLVGRDDPQGDWELTVSSSAIPLPTLGDLAGLAGADVAALLPENLASLGFTISTLELAVNLSQRKMLEFSVGIETSAPWRLIPGRLEVRSAEALLLLDWRSGALFWTGAIAGTVDVVGVPLVLGASTQTGGGWELFALLEPGKQVPVLGLVDQLLKGVWDVSLPKSLLALSLDRLEFTYGTALGTYDFQAALSWPLPDLPGSPRLAASFQLHATRAALGDPLAYSGAVTGSLAVWALQVEVGYQFAPGSDSLTFAVQLQGARLAGALGRRPNPQTGGTDTVLTVGLTGMTLGGVLEWLVGMASPGSGFRLSAPWDVLGSIRFDDFSVVVNLTTKSVGVTYRVNRNLVVAYVDTIGLVYRDRAGTRTVDIEITGDFVGQKYTEAAPLSWDLLNDPPPTPPGKGAQLLDLRFLAFGQNVGFRDTRSFVSVQAVLDAMKAEFLPPAPGAQNPLAALPGLRFTGDGRWLLAADLTVMGAVSLAGVFADPDLYGIRIALAGDRVGKLAGLSFEILYRRVSDDLGVYHLELQLPDAMRQLSFGAVSVTVPIIAVDIYTNGNFRLDFGFPAGLDFSRSFSLQAGPFTGYGGFYLAVLDGATSDRVPRVVNGTFSPVIEFGIALSLGAGRTFDKGVLSAGATLSMVGVVEGVLGWFHPNDATAGTALFYRVAGTIALVGKVYGSVDFAVIKVSVSIRAYASVTLVVEAYQPILVTLRAGVEVSASVKILFFTIHFSFELTLELSFTLGSGSPTPWVLAAGPQPGADPGLRQQRTRWVPRRMRAVELFRFVRATREDAPGWDWTPRNVFGGAVLEVPLLLAPALTVAIPPSVHALFATAGAGDPPAVQVVAALFAPNSIAPAARRAREVCAMEVDGAGDAPFDRLARGMFLWAAGAAGGGTQVTAGDLEALSECLGTRAGRDQAFSWENLSGFLGLNYRVTIEAPAGLGGPSGATGPSGPAGAAAAAIFPMIPVLEMSPAGQDPVPFWTYACVTPAYEANLDAYFAELAPGGPAGLAGAPGPTAPPAPEPTGAAGDGCPPGSQSLSTRVFRDYFAMLARGAVQAAIDLLRAYPYHPTGAGDETLAGVASAFGDVGVHHAAARGETLATVAARYGVTPAQLRRGNPRLAALGAEARLAEGEVVTVDLVTPASIVTANPGYPLNDRPRDPVRMGIAGVRRQLRSGDTLAALARQFGYGDPGAPFAFVPAGATANPNAVNTGLLRPGAPLSIPPFAWTVTAGDMEGGEPLLRVGGRFWVRATPALLAAEWTDWYRQRVLDLNGGTIEGKAVLAAPVASLSVERGIQETGSTPYGRAAGDDLGEIAAVLRLTQLAPDDAGFKAFLARVTAPALITAGSRLGIPALTRAVQPGDTLDAVAAAFGTGAPALAGANAAPGGLLQPLAVLLLPTLDYPIGPNESFATVATRLDLALEELADSVADSAGILAPWSEGAAALTIPDVPARDTALLEADLLAAGKLNQLSAMVSRFLLHGMRVPAPDAPPAAVRGPRGATGGGDPAGPPLWGLYEVLGQQFPAPSATGPDFGVGFRKGAAADWLCFTGPGADGPAGCADGLTLVLGPTFFAENAPSTSFSPAVTLGPTGLALFDLVPPRYGLESSLHWQAATEVPLPGPTGARGPRGATGASGQVTGTAGEPSIWLFPDTLLAQIAAGAAPGGLTGPAYELVAAPPGDATGAGDRPLAAYAWGCAVELQLRRTPGASGAPLSNGYLLLGADTAGRQVLLDAWRFLEDGGGSGRLWLLYPPGVAAGSPQGLASDRMDASATWLLKTNLTTVTRSGSTFFADVLAAAPPSGDYWARATAPGAFLKLAWEASVTGSGGYYLHYVNADGGTGFPDAVFSAGDAGSVWVVLLADAQAGAVPGRGLLPFNNCAVVGESLAAAGSLFARRADPAPGDLRRVANVAPGNVGVHLRRLDPGAPGPGGPRGVTESLYSLLSYRVAGNADFAESREGLPVGPAGPTGGDPRPGSPPAGADEWDYQQVIPVYRLGVANDAPASAALPDAEANPYRGITGPTGPAGRALSSAQVALAFQDVYGNRLDPAAPLGPVTLPVGYTDALIGVGAWPGAAADYLFAPGASGGVELRTRLSLDPTRYLPGGGIGSAQAQASAAADAVRYASVFYQVQQHDTAFALETSLGAPRVDPASLKAPLSAFVWKAKTFVDTAARLLPREHPAAAGDTLGSVAAAYAMTPGMLAAANASLPASRFFTGSVVSPAVAAAPAMNSLASLATLAGTQPRADAPGAISCPAGASSIVRRPAGFVAGIRLASRAELAPSPAPVQAPAADAGIVVTPALLAANNVAAPLSPGLVVRTGRRAVKTPAAFGTVPNTLAGVAASLGASVYALVPGPALPATTVAVGFYPANRATPSLLAPGVTVTLDGVQVVTDASSTFASLYAAFAAAMTEAAFAQAIRDLAGMFLAGADAFADDCVIPAPPPGPAGGPGTPVFSLASLPAGSGKVDWLAENNALTPNFFAAGTPVYLGYACVAPGDFDTPASLAAAAGIPVEQWGAFNASTTLLAGATLSVPDMVYLEAADAAASYAGYEPASTDTLASIADAFGTAAADLAELARELPGVFAQGAAVTAGGQTVRPAGKDSLESVYRAFAALLPGFSWAGFVAAAAAQPGLFRGDGALPVPLPRLPLGALVEPTPAQVAARFNVRDGDMDGAVGPAPLLRANRALQGFLQPGAQVQAPASGGAPIAARANDTVESMLRRFAAVGAGGTLEALAAANADVPGLLAPGVPFLLPPNRTEVDLPLQPVIPAVGAGGENVFFPVTVALRMTRSPWLVSPDFAGEEPVFSTASAVAPRTAAGAGEPLQLTGFAESFESAFAPYLLKAAVSRTGTGDGAGTQQLWAVNFGGGGIASVAVQAYAPQFYALRPLSRELITRDAAIRNYESGTGLGAARTQRFEGVDLDGWMREFLGAVDLFLSPEYSIPAFGLGASGPAWFEARTERAADAAPWSPQAAGPAGLAGVRAPSLGTLLADASRASAPDGPADLDRTVQAKQGVADGLKGQVDAVLLSAGAAGPYPQTAAEALRQQMLVRLSDAYTVNAVVQYPVDVASPFVTPWPGAAGPVPPRFSGDILADFLTLPADPGAGGDTPAYAAGQYGVSTAFLGLALATVPRILRAGATVAYGSGPAYTVGAEDALADVAAWFGVSADPEAPGYWEPWTAFMDGVAPQSFLAPGAALPLTAIGRAVYAGDTLSALADFAGVDAATFAQANQDAPGMVQAERGRVVAVPSHPPYTVQAGDTLRQIVAGVNAQPSDGPPLTVAKLALWLAGLSWLAAGQTLHLVQLLPDVTFSTSKLSLGRFGSTAGPGPNLTFLLTLKHPERFGKLFLNLRYVVNEVEFAIEDVVDGYQSSSWLTFPLPLGSGRGAPVAVRTLLPQVQVPLPLRSYPIPPALLGQSGAATDPAARQVAAAREWDYRFDFQSRNAAQDATHVEVVFNRQEGPDALTGAGLEPLFTPLAEFTAAWPALRGDLARLPALAPGVPDATAAAAVQALSLIAADVAGAFSGGTSFGLFARGGWPERVFGYRMASASDGTDLKTLALGVEEGPTASPLFPDVLVPSPTGWSGPAGPDAGFARLAFQGAVGLTGTYTYPPGVPAAGALTHRFLFAARDVIQDKDGWGGGYLTRNDALVSLGPLGTTGPTGPVGVNPGFVYRTPMVRFIDRMTPLVDNGEPIPLLSATGPTGPFPLSQLLSRMLDQVLELNANGGVQEQIELLCSYGFRVASPGGAGGDGLYATTPIRLVPSVRVGAATRGALAAGLKSSLSSWYAASRPAGAEGTLIFEMTVFTAAGASGPAAPMPVLRLRDLRLPLDSILWDE